MKRTLIGIDNGITGSICIMDENDTIIKLIKMPTKKELSYTKTKQYITRVDIQKLLLSLPIEAPDVYNFAILERPMVNPGRFKASLSAIRALEATLIALEMRKIGFEYQDSKAWQKYFLPHGLKGKDLKHASKEIAIRMYPEQKEIIEKIGDGDAIFIALYRNKKE